MPYTVFDVETRIDKALVKAVYHRGEDVTEETAFEQACRWVVTGDLNQARRSMPYRHYGT